MREEKEEVKKERKTKDQLKILMEFPLGRRKQEIKHVSVQINSVQSTIKQHLTFKKYLIHVLASRAA